MRKKLLIVGQHFWPESFRINDIADFLANEKDCEVDVLCGLPNYPSGKFTEGYGYFKKRHEVYKNIKIERAIEIPRGSNSSIRVFVNYISFPFASLFHIPRLLTKRYDKIFLYQISPVMMSIAGIILGKLTRTETTMYVLDLWPENLYSVLDIKNPILRNIIRSVSHWHYRHVDKLIVLSEKMQSKLIDVTGIASDKICILPQAAEKIYEHEIRDKDLEKRFKKGFNIVFTGSITPAQSFNTIINAAKELHDKGISDINWIIVGDGMSRKQIELDVKKAGLGGIFFFEGQKPVSDIPKYTYIADGLVGCLVKSDLLEATIPAKVMSYIASGKPIILAMDGEVQNLINNEIHGGYVGPTEDYLTLASNIERLYKDSPKDRLRMAKNLKHYHAVNFERNKVLEKLHSFIFS